MSFEQEREFFYKLRQPFDAKQNSYAKSQIISDFYGRHQHYIQIYFPALLCMCGVAFLLPIGILKASGYENNTDLNNNIQFQKLLTPVDNVLKDNLSEAENNISKIQNQSSDISKINQSLAANDYKNFVYYSIKNANEQVKNKNYSQAIDILKNLYLIMDTQKIDLSDKMKHDIITGYDLYSESYLGVQDIKLATEFANKSLNASLDFFGSNSDITAKHYELGAFFCEKNNDINNALSYRHKAILIYQKNNSLDLGTLLVKMNNLGESYRLAKQYNSAVTVISQTIQYIEQKFNTDAPELAVPLNNLALTHVGLRERTKAEAYLIRAYQISRKYQGEHNDVTGYIASNLQRVRGLY